MICVDGVYYYLASTLRENPIWMWRLHRCPCYLVEIKDFLRSYTRCSLKNCFGNLHAVFFNQLHKYGSYCDMVPYQSCYHMITTCWQLGQLKWLQMTQRTTWWRSCDDPDNHWWRSCDYLSDDLKRSWRPKRQLETTSWLPFRQIGDDP